MSNCERFITVRAGEVTAAQAMLGYWESQGADVAEGPAAVLAYVRELEQRLERALVGGASWWFGASMSVVYILTAAALGTIGGRLTFGAWWWEQ